MITEALIISAEGTSTKLHRTFSTSLGFLRLFTEKLVVPDGIGAHWFVACVGFGVVWKKYCIKEEKGIGFFAVYFALWIYGFCTVSV
jgi:hypothetical protein